MKTIAKLAERMPIEARTSVVRRRKRTASAKLPRYSTPKSAQPKKRYRNEWKVACRKSQAPQFARRQCARAQACHVVVGVYEQNVGDCGLARLDYLFGRECALAEKSVAHKLELAYGEDVALAYVCVVAWSVEDAHTVWG